MNPDFEMCTETGEVDIKYNIPNSSWESVATKIAKKEILSTMQGFTVTMMDVSEYTKKIWKNDFEEIYAINLARELNLQAIEKSEQWAVAASTLAVNQLAARIGNMEPKVKFTGIYSYVKENRNNGKWDKVIGAPVASTVSGVGIPKFDVVINIPWLPDPKFKFEFGINNITFKIDKILNVRVTPNDEPTTLVSGNPNFEMTATGKISIVNLIGGSIGGSTSDGDSLKEVSGMLIAENPKCK